MTRDEISNQLRRLKMFGNVDELELNEYVKVLYRFTESYLSRAVEKIILHYQYRRFPLPADIIQYINEAKREEYDARTRSPIVRDNKPAATEAFWKCFRLLVAFKGDDYERWRIEVCDNSPDPAITPEDFLVSYFDGIHKRMLEEKETKNAG